MVLLVGILIFDSVAIVVYDNDNFLLNFLGAVVLFSLIMLLVFGDGQWIGMAPGTLLGRLGCVAHCCGTSRRSQNRDASRVVGGEPGAIGMKADDYESFKSCCLPTLQHYVRCGLSQKWQVDLLQNYHSTFALIEAVRRGDVALIRGSYLVNLSRSADPSMRRLPRRQDIPDEAVLAGPSSWAFYELPHYYRICVSLFAGMALSLAIRSVYGLIIATIQRPASWRTRSEIGSITTFYGTAEIDYSVHTFVGSALIWSLFFIYLFCRMPLKILVENHEVVALSYMWLTPEHPDPV